jgi:Flp pilus assembly pilin Flp
LRVDWAAVVSGLNLAGDFLAIGIAAVQPKLAGAEPSGIEIGKVSARALAYNRVRDLMRDQDPDHIEPHAEREPDGHRDELEGAGHGRVAVCLATSITDRRPEPGRESMTPNLTPRYGPGVLGIGSSDQRDGSSEVTTNLALAGAVRGIMVSPTGGRHILPPQETDSTNESSPGREMERSTFIPKRTRGGFPRPRALEEQAMRNHLIQLWKDEDGQDIAEYAVMLAVILVIVVGTIRLIGSNANTVFSQAASAIQ